MTPKALYALKTDPASVPLRSASIWGASLGRVLLHRFTLLPLAAFVDFLHFFADEGIEAAELPLDPHITSPGQKALSNRGAAMPRCLSSLES